MGKIKIALIGCGNNGHNHLDVLKGMEGLEIVAMVDPRIESLKKEELPKCNLYKDTTVR